MADQQVSILPVRPGTLSADDKAALRKVGVVVIEHENPAELHMLAPAAGAFPSGPVIDAAMAVLALYPTDTKYQATEADVMRSHFVARLAAIRQRERANG